MKPRGRALGDHPTGGNVDVRRGRFGPFVMHGSRVASMPKTMDFDTVTLDDVYSHL